tara:strand:+ start:199 stop:777 length:579 start_codon:yes stop_codon:yes gene_type:complete
MTSLLSSNANHTRLTALLLSLFIFGLATSCQSGTVSISIDESKVQERVAKEFPQEHDLRGIATLTMKNPQIDLGIGDNRIGLLTDLEVSRTGIPIAAKGKAKTSGVVRYEAKDGTFYMTDVRIEDVELPLPLIKAEQKQKILDHTNAILQGTLRDIPIHTLHTTTSKEAASALLKSIEVKEKKIAITLGLNN